MNEAASEQRNTAAAATSSGDPNRPIGMSDSIRSPVAGSSRSLDVMSVSIQPGASAFTRTPFGAHSTAVVFVRLIIAAFAAP